MAGHLVHSEVLGRAIRAGGWRELAEGTPRLIRRALEAGDEAGVAELVPFFLSEMRVVHDIYALWFPQTLKCLVDKGMAPGEAARRHEAVRARLAPFHPSALRPREEVWAEIGAALALVQDTALPATERHAALDAATGTWRELHDCEVDQLTGLFDVVMSEHGEPALLEMYEGWVVGDWFAKRYRRFDVSEMPWETAHWLLVYLAFEGMHGHLSGAARDGTIEVAEDAEKITLSFAPCGSGGRTLQGEPRDGLPPLRDPAIGWGELSDAHDFTWNEKGVCSYCAHCAVLHETLPIAAFGYPVRVTEPPTAPLDGESRCRWSVYKNLRDIPEWAYTRVGAIKPPADAPLGSAGRAERDAMIAAAGAPGA